MRRFVRWTLAVCLVGLARGQTVPMFIPDGRPPPVQEENYVENILDDLLNGRCCALVRRTLLL